MDRKHKVQVAASMGVLAACVTCWLVLSGILPSGSAHHAKAGSAESRAVVPVAEAQELRAPTSRSPKMVKDADEDSPEDGEDGQMEDGGEVSQTEEEKRADAEEALVDAFDGLTDKWMEPSDNGVSMEDVQKFLEQFRKVPKGRKGECLQRALNLVPDDNVLLLAGILMDKTQDREYLEMIYNDVLNRDEKVKKSILEQIFNDKTHPCWADTAWIFDVTGKEPDADSGENGGENANRQ